MLRQTKKGENHVKDHDTFRGDSSFSMVNLVNAQGGVVK